MEKMPNFSRILKIAEIGRAKGYLSILEYSFKNLGIPSNKSIDVAWLDKATGEVICLFEVDSSKNGARTNLAKLIQCPEIRNYVSILIKKGIIQIYSYSSGSKDIMEEIKREVK